MLLATGLELPTDVPRLVRAGRVLRNMFRKCPEGFNMCIVHVWSMRVEADE